MKIKKSKLYKKIYISNNKEKVSLKDMNNFLFCGDINWDYYFNKKIPNSGEVKNAKLLEFYNQKDMEKYLAKMKRIELLDHFLEKDYFAVLEI